MKKILFILATLLFAVPVFSQWDGTSSPWSQGTGTQSDPYQISSPHHLAFLADMVTSGVNDYEGKYFLLTQDISLSNQSWMPIGDEEHAFKGYFDGGGHTIDSIYVNNTTYSYTGLFGKIDNGEIRNLDFSINLYSGSTRGALCAEVYNSGFYGCTAVVKSTGAPQFLGGLIGKSYGRVVIENSEVTATSGLYASSEVGGVLSHNYGSSSYISNCRFGGILSGLGTSGGIVGYSVGTDTIENCINIGRTYGYSNVGGIIGRANQVCILDCANLDSVVSRSNQRRNVCIGGIVGYAAGGKVSMCYNKGVIKVEGVFGHSSTHARFGSPTANEYRVNASGIGSSYVTDTRYHIHNPSASQYFCTYDACVPTSNLTLQYCYNTGRISIPKYSRDLENTSYNSNCPQDGCQAYGIGYNSYNSYNVGFINLLGGTGLFGESWGASYTGQNRYYLSGGGAYQGGSSRTAAQMRSPSFPIVLNADSTVFVMDENNYNSGYPIFRPSFYDVTTDSATNITSYSATFNGHFSGNADTAGFIYGYVNNGLYSYTSTIMFLATQNTFQHFEQSDVANVTFWYVFFAKKGDLVSYGDTATVATYPEYTVITNVTNSSHGSVSGGGTYGYGQIAILTATAAEHYQFRQWQDGNTDNPRLVTVMGNDTYTAEFETAQYTITALANNPSWGSVVGTGTYTYNTPFLLTAIPSTGHHFEYWLEESSQTMYFEEYNPMSFMATRDETYTAYFAVDQHSVNVLSNNDTMGYVTGGGVYNYGQQIYIMAHPYGNYIFTQWSDGDTQPSRLITVTEDVTYTAIFTDAIFNITGLSNNVAFGSVSGGGGYARGSQVQLTAIPNAGYHFTQWSDGNTDNPRTITVNADATYTAQFAANTYVVNVNSNNTLMGSATGGGIFSYGQQATIEATALPHYRFVQWSDGNNSNPRMVTVTSDTTFTAMFEQMPQYTITVVSADETKGSVSGGGTFYGGETTVINAIAASGNVFDRWSDGNTEAIRTITVTSDATYTAYFSGVRYTVNVYSNDDQMGTVSGGGEYEQGTQATVTATPANGCRFVRWNNGVETNPYTFTVYSDVNIIANFERSAGVDEAENFPYTITSRATAVVVGGAENRNVCVRDVLGRTVFASAMYDGGWVELRSAGVYFVTVDGNKTKKIVLINK